MKKVLVILGVIMTSISMNTQAQDTDLQLVEQTLNNYLVGLTGGDDELIKNAFYADAEMKFMDGDKYQTVNAIEALTAGNDPTGLKVSTRVVSVNIAGNAASAQLEIQFPEFTYIDFMSLLKVNGEWKIVNKVFYTRTEE